MSNAMSLSKSRWKGALLATVAVSVLTPLAASAQTTPGSMTLSLSLAPMSTVITNQGGPVVGQDGTTEYVAPDTSYPIYVYATVAESGNIANNNVAGLQYAYFNVLQNYTANLNPVNGTGINTSDGTVTVASTSPLFSAYGSQNGASGATSGYYAVGGGAAITSQGAAISAAAASSMSLLGKARSTSPVWSNGVSNDGTNVYISGNTVSFLLETLTYTPAFIGNAKNFNDPTLGENTFTVNVPTLPTNYAGANFFTGNPSGTTGSEHNGSVGASYTHTAYSAGNVTIGGYTFSSTVALYDAAIGDAHLEGQIDLGDVSAVGNAYNNGLTGWTNGDFFDDGFVTLADISAVGNDYNNSAEYGPFLEGTGPSALIAASIGGSSAVPEPVSLTLLSLASLGLLSRGRGRRSV